MFSIAVHVEVFDTVKTSISSRWCRHTSRIRLAGRLAGRSTHQLRLANEHARFHGRAQTVRSAQIAGHGRCIEMGEPMKRRAADLGLVAQSVTVDSGFGGRRGHGGILLCPIHGYAGTRRFMPSQEW